MSEMRDRYETLQDSIHLVRCEIANARHRQTALTNDARRAERACAHLDKLPQSIERDVARATWRGIEEGALESVAQEQETINALLGREVELVDESNTLAKELRAARELGQPAEWRKEPVP